MKIYLYLDNDDIEEISALAEPMIAAMEAWLVSSQSSATLVNQQGSGRSAWDMGLVIETKKKSTLAKPLDFLYELAKTHEQEFVIGLSDKNGNEDICYFGFEEGKPDIHEVASYLGLPK